MYSSRACPSRQALAEAKRVGGEVVWLVNPPYDQPDDDYYEFEPWENREAVMIRGYLPHKIKNDYGSYYDTSYELYREF